MSVWPSPGDAEAAMHEFGTLTNRPLVYLHHHAVVAGFGIVGRMVAEAFHAQNVRVTLIETNQRTIEVQQNQHESVVHGDVRDPAVLTQAGIDRADVLVLTIPDEDVAIEACKVARAIKPDLYIVARTNFFSRGLMASQAGADMVVVEEVATAHAMQRAIQVSGGPSGIGESIGESISESDDDPTSGSGDASEAAAG